MAHLQIDEWSRIPTDQASATGTLEQWNTGTTRLDGVQTPSLHRRFPRALRPLRQFNVMPIRTPTIVNRGALSYFFDADRNRWRVYDSVEEPHQSRPYRQIYPLGDSRATVRCFAPADKTATHYVYAFRDDADRAIRPELLLTQLSAARPYQRRLFYQGAPKS
jgi:hypothetical protein